MIEQEENDKQQRWYEYRGQASYVTYSLKRKSFKQDSKIQESEELDSSVWVQNSMKGQKPRTNNAGRVSRRVKMGWIGKWKWKISPDGWNCWRKEEEKLEE